MRLLASEDEGYTFIDLTMGKPILDEHGFLKGLVQLLRKHRPFHWNRGSGIVHTLETVCRDVRNRLGDDLGKLESGMNRDQEGKVLWLYPATYCIRYAMGLHSLVEEGFPSWSKRAVLRRGGSRRHAPP